MSNPTFVTISYSNAVIPKFDSDDRPDLLGWDEAMAEHEDNKDTLAVFYNKAVLEACKPIIEEMYSDEEKLIDTYESDYVSLDFHQPTEDKPTLGWFWKEVVGDCFDCEKWADSDDNITDHEGNPFDWEGGGYINQKPTFDNYIVACQDHLLDLLKQAIRPVDFSASQFHEWLINDQKKLITLGEELYSAEESYDDLYY